MAENVIEKKVVDAAGVDVGFGAVKSCIFNGRVRTNCFPRLLSRDEATGFEELRGLTDYGIGGRRYLIGEDALFYSENIIEDEAKDYMHRDEYWLCVAKAFHDSGVFSGSDSVSLGRLVLGVAPGYFTPEIRDSLKQRAAKGIEFTVKDRVYSFRAEHCHVLPQGAGAYFRYMLNEFGGTKSTSEYQYLYGICDIGFRTTDFILFEQGKFLGGKRLSEDIGVRTVMESLQDYISKTYDNYSCHIGFTADVIRGKPLMYKGGDVDLSDVTGKMVADLTDRIEKAVMKRWEDGLNRMKKLILCGGGAYHFGNGFLKDNKSQIHIPKSPELSNAIGFYRYGRMENNKK